MFRQESYLYSSTKPRNITAMSPKGAFWFSAVLLSWPGNPPSTREGKFTHDCHLLFRNTESEEMTSARVKWACMNRPIVGTDPLYEQFFE